MQWIYWAKCYKNMCFSNKLMPDGIFAGEEGEEELVEDDGAEILVYEFLPHLILKVFK